MQLGPWTGLWIVGVLVLALGGCATRICDEVAKDGPPRHLRFADALARRASLAELWRAFPAETLDVLVMSGGGANGAWGAGVLSGWREVGRPDFHVVTGVSTGALLATFAFLGTEPDDEVIRSAYTSVASNDIYEGRYAWLIPFSVSLATTEPLEKLISRHVTDAIVDRVAERGREGRLLFVGTVNLDSGRLVPWDMTALAMSELPERHDLFRRVLLASASFPVAFPPVIIDGAMHVDGAVRENLFVSELLEPMCADYAAGGHGDPPVVWALVNGRIGLEAECVQQAIVDIGVRAVYVLMDEVLVGNLARVQLLAQNHGIDLRISHIPQDHSSPSIDFDPEAMRRLFDLGVAWVSEAAESGWPRDLEDLRSAP